MKIISDRYPDMVTSLTNMDLSVEAEAFGATVKFADTETPSVTGRLIADIENVSELQIPKVGAGCDIPPKAPIENVDAFFEEIWRHNTK
jgi:uroporphyrinogen decarboxylase